MTAPTRPTSIALLDISYLFKKRFHTVTDGQPLGAAKATLQDIENLKRGVGHVIICRDAPPYSHRLAIFPAYKATRPEVTTEEIAQKKWLWSEIKRLGLNVAWCQGYEADDVIATLANEYGQWCADVRIVGPDKDVSQCVRQNVVQYIPPVGDRDWEIRDVAGVQKKFGVFPDFMCLYQALVGDSSDNIPGVPKVGPKTAAELVNKYQTIERLAAGMAGDAASMGSSPSAVVKSLAANWSDLVLSLKLVTLDTKVPVDTEALLVRREAEPQAPARNNMDIELDGYQGNETPAPPKQDGVTDAAFEEALQAYQDKVPVLQQAQKDAELLEKENDREREKNEEHEAREQAEKPAPKSMVVPSPVKVRPPAPPTTALATAPAYTQSKYGIVTADLQPLDLQSAYTLSEWFHKGGLYCKKYKNEAQIFTIMAKGKELGLKMTVALDNFHVIEGKPSASADLIRALAERDPNFEYLMCTERSPTKCVWRGKHKKHPAYVDFPYTIEDAKLAGLLRSADYGKDSNWKMRPQDMLSKTAASKLARELWPSAVMGLYCLEELGTTAEELEAREAA